MTTLICGSLAFDVIMTYPGRFSGALLPDQLHQINVSFLAPTMRRAFGGCAGNIAYNLQLLGGEPFILASAGQDIAPYLDHLKGVGISCAGIRVRDDAYTAQCFITTDTDHNQITVFHPGAMSYSHENVVPKDKMSDITHAIVAPDGRDGMIRHATFAAEHNIPLIFDPGQGMPMFTGEELQHFLDLASYVTVNDYELALLIERSGLSVKHIVERVRALIVTHGARGSTIHTPQQAITLPSVQPQPHSDTLDPTGCGDAFRAGLLYGLQKGMDWEMTGRLANLMGCLKIEHLGTQNHAPSKAEIDERFYGAFGVRI